MPLERGRAARSLGRVQAFRNEADARAAYESQQAAQAEPKPSRRWAPRRRPAAKGRIARGSFPGSAGSGPEPGATAPGAPTHGEALNTSPSETTRPSATVAKSTTCVPGRSIPTSRNRPALPGESG